MAFHDGSGKPLPRSRMSPHCLGGTAERAEISRAPRSALSLSPPRRSRSASRRRAWGAAFEPCTVMRGPCPLSTFRSPRSPLLVSVSLVASRPRCVISFEILEMMEPGRLPAVRVLWLTATAHRFVTMAARVWESCRCPLGSAVSDRETDSRLHYKNGLLRRGFQANSRKPSPLSLGYVKI